jgi:hypothetical protein
VFDALYVAYIKFEGTPKIALFVAETIMGVAHALDLKWILEGKAYTSTYCTAQGALYTVYEMIV